MSVDLSGQLGNQMFEIATAYAYALDHGIPLLVPDLANRGDADGTAENARRLFQKVSSEPWPVSPTCDYTESGFEYHPLPITERLHLHGYFQSERYFAHRRAEILELFQFDPKIWAEVLKRYPQLKHPHKVGVHVRPYFFETGTDFYPSFGTHYFRRAIEQFPPDCLFVVCSNALDYAKKVMAPIAGRQFLFIEGTNRFDDMMILSKCDHLIGSNSSFSWWAAWLEDRAGRRVIMPRPWFGPALPLNIQDLVPDRWEILDSYSEAP
ncbi:MAG: alpha-1,2-fucosyltransferase [Chlamydiia bacterium]